METYFVNRFITKDIIPEQDIIFIRNTSGGYAAGKYGNHTYCIFVLWHGMAGAAVFLFLYMARSYAGGYHADTRMKCYIYSSLLAAAIFPIIKISQYRSILFLEIVFAAGIILYLAPVENIKNHWKM